MKQLALVITVIISILVSIFQINQQESVNFKKEEVELRLNSLRVLVVENPDTVIQEIRLLLGSPVVLENFDLLAKFEYTLGIAHYFKGEYLISNYFYDRVLDLGVKEVGEKIIEAVHNNKGVNYELIEDYEKAILSYLSSLEFANQRESQIGIGQTILNLGVLFQKIGKKDESIIYLEEALDIFEKEEDVYHIALANMNIGTFEAITDFDKGYAKLIKALESFERLEQNFNVAETRYNLGTAYFNNGKYEMAKEYALSSLKIQNPEIFNSNKINTITLLVDIHVGLNDFDAAAVYVDQLISAIESGKVNEDYLDNSSFDSFISVYDRLGSNERIQNILSIKNEFFSSSKAERYSLIYEQYLVLSEISEQYADSVKNDTALLASQSEVNILYKPLIVILVVAITLLCGFISYQNRKEMDNVHKIDNKLKKTEHLLDSFKLMNRDVKDEAFDEQFIEYEAESDNLKELFLTIDEYLKNEEAFTKDGITREQIARRFHTNKKYVSLAIKEYSGYSFNDYVNNFRVAKAIKIYRNNPVDLSNAEISYSCGYSSESTFYRNFNKFTGTTPQVFLSRLNRNRNISRKVG